MERKIIFPQYIKSELRKYESKIQRLRLVGERITSDGINEVIIEYDITHSLPMFSEYTCDDYLEYTSELCKRSEKEEIIQLIGTLMNQCNIGVNTLHEHLYTVNNNIMNMTNALMADTESKHLDMIGALNHVGSNIIENVNKIVNEGSNNVISHVSSIMPKQVEDRSDEFKFERRRMNETARKRRRLMQKMYEMPIFHGLIRTKQLSFEATVGMTDLEVFMVDHNVSCSDGKILYEIKFKDCNGIIHYIYITNRVGTVGLSKTLNQLNRIGYLADLTTVDIVMRRGTAKMLFNVENCATEMCMLNLLTNYSTIGKYEGCLGSISRLIKVPKLNNLINIVKNCFADSLINFDRLIDGILSQYCGTFGSQYINYCYDQPTEIKHDAFLIGIIENKEKSVNEKIQLIENGFDMIKLDRRMDECIEKIETRVAARRGSNYDLMFGSNHYSGTRTACDMRWTRYDKFGYHTCNVRVKAIGFSMIEGKCRNDTCFICKRMYGHVGDAQLCGEFCLLFNLRGRQDYFCNRIKCFDKADTVLNNNEVNKEHEKDLKILFKM